LLTIALELLVAWLYLWYWLRWRGEQLTTVLILVCLLDLVTVPLVWFFFPSFAPFVSYEIRSLGIFLAALGVYVTIMLYLIFVHFAGRIRRILIISNLIILGFLIPICSFAIILGVGYGSMYEPIPAGLSASCC
jgi:hypothetical protein